MVTLASGLYNIWEKAFVPECRIRAPGSKIGERDKCVTCLRAKGDKQRNKVIRRRTRRYNGRLLRDHHIILMKGHLNFSLLLPKTWAISSAILVGPAKSTFTLQFLHLLNSLFFYCISCSAYVQNAPSRSSCCLSVGFDGW